MYKLYYSLIAAAVLSVLITTNACKKPCSGSGKLKLTNKSMNTVHRLMVDGVNYGTIDPGESKEISLAAGEHTFQQVGISGGVGCSAAKVIIVECETSSFSCNN
jgi:hypothetical protein